MEREGGREGGGESAIFRNHHHIIPCLVHACLSYLTELAGTVCSGRTRANGQDPEPTWVARHPLKLRSAYSEVTGSEPPYTTCHSKFLGTVDYMWFTPQVGA